MWALRSCAKGPFIYDQQCVLSQTFTGEGGHSGVLGRVHGDDRTLNTQKTVFRKAEKPPQKF